MNSLIHNETVEKILKLLPKGITAVLAIVLAVMLASLFWLIATPQSDLPTASVAQKPEVKTPSPAKNYGQMVAKQHVFGKEPVKVKNTAPKPKNTITPVTRLNLVLYGIVAREGRKSYAIIANGKQAKQQIYGIGEEPQAGVTIDSILPKKVILRHGGKLEELLLPVKKNVSRSNAHLPSIPNNVAKAGKIGATALPVNSGGNKLPEEDLGALRDTLTNNPDRLLEIASITEAKDKDGNLTGYRLSPGKNRKMFRKLGLRPGDILTQVNGIVLDSPAKGLMVMTELSSAASIAITVKRGDQEVSIEKSF
ncbi:MAG: type II secretion system protein GspC [Thiotrichaceae bacterium]